MTEPRIIPPDEARDIAQEAAKLAEGDPYGLHTRYDPKHVRDLAQTVAVQGERIRAAMQISGNKSMTYEDRLVAIRIRLSGLRDGFPVGGETS